MLVEAKIIINVVNQDSTKDAIDAAKDAIDAAKEWFLESERHLDTIVENCFEYKVID